MIDQLLISFLVLVVVGLTILLIKRGSKKEDNSLVMQQLNQINQLLDNRLSESFKTMQIQHGQNIKIIQTVTEKLTKFDETNKQIVGFAEQLQSLENVLINPKQRGILGEYYLEELLKNVFSPCQYKMQYEFKDGKTVDAVIFVKDKIIPIDSKFSLENYNRIVEEKDSFKRQQIEKTFKQDLKNRIDETAKYIRPDEGTLEFAFMFIPAEAIYYDLLVNKIGAVKSNTRDLIEYAVREKHVHIVSPTSFCAYLQTILQGLRALQIEESAKEIRKGVEVLARHMGNYDEYFRKLGNNLGATVGAYNNAYKEFGKIDKDIIKIKGGQTDVKIKQLEKPSMEE